MQKCQVENCKREGKHCHIGINSPDSTGFNVFLCESHYERLLDVVRATIQFQLPLPPSKEEKQL